MNCTPVGSGGQAQNHKMLWLLGASHRNMLLSRVPTARPRSGRAGPRPGAGRPRARAGRPQPGRGLSTAAGGLPTERAFHCGRLPRHSRVPPRVPPPPVPPAAGAAASGGQLPTRCVVPGVVAGHVATYRPGAWYPGLSPGTWPPTGQVRTTAAVGPDSRSPTGWVRSGPDPYGQARGASVVGRKRLRSYGRGGSARGGRTLRTGSSRPAVRTASLRGQKERAATSPAGAASQVRIIRPSDGSAARRTARCASTRRRLVRPSARIIHTATERGTQPRSAAIFGARRRFRSRTPAAPGHRRSRS